MTTQDVHAPTLGAQGEPCASCGMPLAADQRYCLQCGARRAEARLAFHEILAGQAPPAVIGSAAAAFEDRPPPRAGLAFLAGLLCLLVALGVGVLIGRTGNDTPKAAATPASQVITVGGAAATGTTPAAGTGTDAAGTSSPSGASSSSGSSGSGSSSSSSSKSSKSTSKSVKDLDSTSGSDFQKKSGKLPKEVGTGGKPAAKDNKPAGGGSDFEDIG